jgi:lysophospholipase L1-like esterase
VAECAAGSTRQRGRIIAEGLNGRTTAFDDHLADCDRNGARILPTILQTHAPLDLVILLLGTNDMKPVVAGSAFRRLPGHRKAGPADPQSCLAVRVRCADILIVAPPKICETANVPFAASFRRRHRGIGEAGDALPRSRRRTRLRLLRRQFGRQDHAARWHPSRCRQYPRSRARLESTVRMMLGL